MTQFLFSTWITLRAAKLEAVLLVKYRCFVSTKGLIILSLVVFTKAIRGFVLLLVRLLTTDLCLCRNWGGLLTLLSSILIACGDKIWLSLALAFVIFLAVFWLRFCFRLLIRADCQIRVEDRVGHERGRLNHGKPTRHAKHNAVHDWSISSDRKE